MKTTQDHFRNETAATQGRVENIRLRDNKLKPNNTMKKMQHRILVLLAAVSPLLLQAQTLETFTFTTNRLVPDGNPSGLVDARNVNSAIGTISSLQVGLKVTGEFNGDLYAYLRHTNGFVILLNRAGRTASNPHGYADSGMNVTFQAGAANGDLHVYQKVTTPASGSPLTGIWDVDGRDVDPTNVTDVSPRSTSLTNFNGLNGAGEWTLYLADMESGGTNMLTEWTLSISGAASPTLAWANPADITYGTALSGTQLNAAATYNSTNVPGTFSYTLALGAVLNAGLDQTLSLTFTPADTSSFLPITTNVTINVRPAPLTITANNATNVYGAALPPLTARYSGFVLGQGENDLTGLATITTTATAMSDVGSYPITPSGATSSNYTFAYVNGSLTVTQSLSAGVLASSANPALPGSNVTFSATVSAVAPGGGTPGGTVNFRVDGSIAGSGTLSGGVATFTTNILSRGSHTVLAEYAGNLDFVGTTNSLTPSLLINTPPIAGNLTIERYPTQGVKVNLSTLLTNDSDAYGDTLRIAVSSTSANGATIAVIGNWVFYTQATGFANADSFTYTITDSYGANATGTVTVAIEVDTDASQNLIVTDLGNGSSLIDGSGIPARTYRLQYTAASGPADWQDIPGGSVTADSAGAFEYTDTRDTGTSLYRTVYP